jgi:hypothetical protein
MYKIVKRLRLPSCNALLVATMISTRNKATKLMTDKEIVINDIWKRTLLLLLMYRKFPHLLTTTRSNHLCITKNNWTSILQRISTGEENIINILPSLLFQLLLFEFSFCNGLCRTYSRYIYTIPIPMQVVECVEPDIVREKIRIQLEKCDNTKFFQLDSDDDDNDETPLLRNDRNSLYKKTKNVCQRIKAFFVY